MDDVITWVRGAIWSIRAQTNIERIHCIGTSSGGFIALIAGHALRANNVWAFSPSNLSESLRDELVARLGQSNHVTRYDIWFGSEHAKDAETASVIGQCPDVAIHPVPTDDHMVAHAMWVTRQLPQLLAPAPTDGDDRRAGTHETPADSVVEVEDVFRLVRTVAPHDPIARDTPLAGVLDSFAMTQLFVLIEKHFSIRIDFSAITMDDVATVEQLAVAISRWRSNA
jgi:acyl carrier protein